MFREQPQPCQDLRPSRASLWHRRRTRSPSRGRCLRRAAGWAPGEGARSPPTPPSLTAHRHPLSSPSLPGPFHKHGLCDPVLSLQQECFSGPGAPCSGAGLFCAPCHEQRPPLLDAGAQAGMGATSTSAPGRGARPHAKPLRAGLRCWARGDAG